MSSIHTESVSRKQVRLYAAFSILELLLMTAVIWFDVLIPSIVVTALGLVFVWLRGEKLPLELPVMKRSGAVYLMAVLFGWAVVWTVVEYALILPLQNHLLQDTRDVSSFATVHGNLPMLGLYLLLTWTLAAVVEEFAFRGFLQRRIILLFRRPSLGVPIAVFSTSLLFGLLHAEQGVVSFAVTTIDGAFFSFIRYRYRSVWASVLVHGFLNTIGLIAFYFAGPLYGLW